MTVPLIQTAEVLAAQVAQWAEAPWLCVDTEFVREETYYAQLCLVQVSDGRHAAIIDALTLTDLAPLWQLLQAAQSTKVLHAAGQDLELFVQMSGDCPRPLFDTQIAAALLGYGEQMGYAGLVEKLLGLKVDKSLSRTDWTRRPLSAAALEYAADDVRHLAVIYPQLRAELEVRGRLAWLEEDCQRQADPTLYASDPELAWRKLKGLSRLPAEAQALAVRLAAWREREARLRNRPRRWIIDDEALCAIAARRPETRDEYASLQGVPAKVADRYAEAWQALLQDSGAAAPSLSLRMPLEGAERNLLRQMQDCLRTIATQEQIVASYIASREDLEALVRLGADAPVAVLRGWRRQVAGEALLKLRG